MKHMIYIPYKKLILFLVVAVILYIAYRLSQPLGLIGYASLNGGVSGGKGGQIYIVSDYIGLKAIISSDKPKQIMISGTIQMQIGSKDKSLRVGSNTTIKGIGIGAKIQGNGLRIKGKTNIIIQNIMFENAYDPNLGYPKTKPEVDAISIDDGSTQIWIDHCSFSDGAEIDANAIHHDGLIDITSGSDYITVSYSLFENHTKVMLIGADDKDYGDIGKLHVTLHHLVFSGTSERNPRVRFGKVHVFNCIYNDIRDYAIGVGKYSKIYSEENLFGRGEKITSFPAGKDQSGFIYDVGSSINVSGWIKRELATGVSLDDYGYMYQCESFNKESSLEKYVGAGKLEMKNREMLQTKIENFFIQ